MIASQRRRIAIVALFTSLTCAAQNPFTDWPIIGGSSENTHYSPLTQIDRTNVQKLQPAWTYDTKPLEAAA